MRIAVLDIGGTMIKSAIFVDRTLFDVQETPRPADHSGPSTLAAATELLDQMGPFSAIGISISGQVDPARGVIRGGLDPTGELIGTEIRKTLETRFSVPVAVENDVNAAAMGEARFGAGMDQQNFLCLTYGTGVGGAIIMNGELYRGSCYSAGEFGLMTTRPELRKQQGGFPGGIYNDLASTTALVRKAGTYNPAIRNGKDVFDRLDDPEVRSIVDDWIDEILIGLSNLIHIFNPSCMILGGGVMEQSWILDELKCRLPEYIMEGFRNVELCQARNGNRAGLLGAAVLAEELWSTRESALRKQ